MCDTCVALPSVTKDGVAYFAKNSDREPNEAQDLCMFPAQDHPEGSDLQCTYITIPQVRHTYQVLLSKPYWMWGAEMGANECGVVIGNEAIFLKVPAKKEPGLIGMDYLRLALERASTAKAALETITTLLARYGQSGNCSKEHGLYYHNSYLIMDSHEAYVLETVDRMWIARKVTDTYVISNAASITTEWDDISPGLIEYACKRGWCKDAADFNFAEMFSDAIFTKFSQGRERREHLMQFMQREKGKNELQTMKAMLRSHAMNPQASFPDKTWTAWNVCMHAGPGPIRNSQAVASMITAFSNDDITHWVTGTSAPCLSVFKPVWMKAGLPDMGPHSTEKFDQRSLWWDHERIHRRVLQDFPTRHAYLSGEIGDLEKKIEESVRVLEKNDSKKGRLTTSAFKQERDLYPNWMAALDKMPPEHKNGWFYTKYWQKNNQKAQITV